ncbi:hypothetical protein QTP88_019197 [Uroleucon formosanum]
MLKTIALSYRLGERTVSNIVNEVCAALWNRLQPFYIPVPTVETWKNITLDYERKWQYYNCLGAVDGKHIAIRKPLLSGSSFYNYKQYFSIVLMATVDANYRFTTVNVGSMVGFYNCPNQNRYLGKIQKLRMFGDEAFPLMPNLMRQYPRARVTGNYENKFFNYRLSRARQIVESSFGILTARFRVYKRSFECKLDTIDKVVLAKIVLHNYLRTDILSNASIQDEDDEIAYSFDESNFSSLAPNRSKSSNEAFSIRQNFTECFNSNYGSVDWQRKQYKGDSFE